MLIEDTLLIHDPGTFLGKKSRRVVVKTPNDQIQESSLLKLKEITLVGKGISLSNDLIYQATKLGVAVNFLDRNGRFYAKITSPFLSQTIETARAQIAAENSSKAIELAKEIVLTKINNQQNLIRFFLKHQNLYYLEKSEKLRQLLLSINLLREQLKKASLNKKNFQNILFSFEGRSSDLYWKGIKVLLEAKVEFIRRTGRGAKDLVNALLNYGYGILYSRTLSAILTSGLLPYAGFLHSDRSGKPSLVLDITEIFRQPVVDHVVITFLSKKKQKIEEPDKEVLFEFAKRVIERLEEKGIFNKKRYSFEKIINLQVQNIASFLRDDTSLNIFNQ